jgi:2-methylcitrate dehydratase PrpD
VRVHPTIEAVLDLREEHDVAPEDISSIEATVNDYVSWVTAKRNPATGLEGKFSIYHSAAVAAVDGAASVRQFTDERVSDPAIAAMRGRVSIVVDEALPKDAATVIMTLADGRSFSRTVSHNKGTPGHPMSDEEIEAKFMELAEERVGDEAARRVAEKCWDLEHQGDVGAIVKLCEGAPR